MFRYTNYELDFLEHIEWDEDQVKLCLADFDYKTLYPNGARILISVNNQHNILDILDILFDIYFTDMLYREYGKTEWLKRRR